MVWFLICFPNWMTPNGKAKDGIYRRGAFFLFFLFWCCEWKMEIGITDHIPIFLFLILNWEKEKETWLSHSHFSYGIGERKTKGRYIQHMVLFRFSKKTKIGITDHISIFRFFVWGLGNRNRMISCPFLYFLLWIRKTKNENTDRNC